MSKKSVYASLILLSVLTLVACSKEQDKQVVTSSSSSSSVVESSSSSVVESSSSTKQSSDTTATSSTQSHSSRFDLDVSKLEDYGYTVPANIKQYVGSYSAQGVFKDSLFAHKDIKSSQVDIVINEDGTYRQVIKTYVRANWTNAESNGYQTNGYFDSIGKFHTQTLPTVDIAGDPHAENPVMEYAQGVLVEAFGDVYLVPLTELSDETSGTSSYIAEDGRIDDVASLVSLQYRRLYGRQFWKGSSGINSFHETYPDINYEFVVDNSRNHEAHDTAGFRIQNMSDSLDSYLSFKDGKLSGLGVEFKATTEVSPAVKKPLSELFTEEAVEKMLSTPNGIYQLVVGSNVSYKDIRPELLDLTKVYSKTTGKPVSDGFGIKVGDYAIVVGDSVLYELTATDGKFIIKDDN